MIKTLEQLEIATRKMLFLYIKELNKIVSKKTSFYNRKGSRIQ